MSPESIAVINDLIQHGLTSSEQLCARFAYQSRSALIKRCRNLRDLGHLKSQTIDGVMHWEACTLIRKAKADKPRTASPATTLQVAGPRQVNVMFGPTYAPSPAFVTRSGALDATRIPSRGIRC